MKCKNCKEEMVIKEEWFDTDEENQKHLSFYHCPNCKKIFSVNGEEVNLS